jgi:hypothetical protein
VDKLIDYMGPFSVPAADGVVPLQPALAAHGVRPGQRPAQPRLRGGAGAGPAGRAPVHPPGVARAWWACCASWRPRSRYDRCSSGGCPVSLRRPRVSVLGCACH